MATLPGPDAVGPLPDNLPRRMGVGGWRPEIISQDMGAAGRGLEQLGSGMSDFEAKQQSQDDQLQVAQAHAKVYAGTTGILSNLPTLTDPAAIAAQKDNVAGIVSDAASGIQNPRTRQLFEANIVPHTAEVGLHIDAHGRQITNSGAIANYEQTANSTIGSAATIDDDALSSRSLDSINGHLQALQDGGIITPVERQARAQKAAIDYVDARYKYLYQQAIADPNHDTTRLERFISSTGLGQNGGAPGAGGAPPPDSGNLNWAQDSGNAQHPGPQLADKSRYLMTVGVNTLGATPAAAAAMVGNTIAESSLKTTAANEQGESSHGLFQWNQDAGRWQPFVAWASANGKSTNDPAAQMQYAKVESQKMQMNDGTGRSVWDAVNQARTPQEANHIWLTKFESPADQSQMVHDWRQKNVDYALNAFSGASPFRGLPAASAGPGPATAPTAANSFFLGDSVADGLMKAVPGGRGNTLQGRSPIDVQNAIARADPADLAGKTIYLSSGASNAYDPRNMAAVQSQIKTLTDPVAQGGKGVSPSQIRLIGVGDRADFTSNNVNGQLADIAKKTGVTFTGPLDATNLRHNPRPGDNSDDGVHFADWKQGLTSVAGTNAMNVGGPQITDASSAHPLIPPKSQWPSGTDHVAPNGDGTYSFVGQNGLVTPVPGLQPTGTPTAQLPPHPTGALIDALPVQQRANMVLSAQHDIETLQNMRNKENTAADKALVGTIKDAQNQMVSGQMPTDDAWNQIKAAGASSTNPETRRMIAEADATRAELTKYSSMTPQQIAADVDNKRADYAASMKSDPFSPFTTMKGAVVSAAEAYQKRLSTDLAKDQWGRASADGVEKNFYPIQPGDPNLVAAIQKRVADAEVVKDHYGIEQPVMLNNAEKVQLRKLAQTGGQPMIDMAKAIVQGGGDKAGQFLKEIGADAPRLWAVGALAADPNADHSVAINDIAAYTAAENDKDARSGLPRFNTHMLKAAGVDPPFGDALAGFGPDVAGRYVAAANTLMGARAQREGKDPSIDHSFIDQAYVKDAYNKALGATMTPDGNQFGGVTSRGGGWTGPYKQNVVVPTNVNADKFNDVIDTLNDTDLAKMGSLPMKAGGKPMTAADIKNGQLIAVPSKADGLFHGQYGVVIGDPNSPDARPVLNEQGKPWVFDMSKMEDTFRQRMPGAYMDKPLVKRDDRAPRAAPSPYRNTPGMVADNAGAGAPSVPQED